jgi:hypothetical protein
MVAYYMVAHYSESPPVSCVTAGHSGAILKILLFHRWRALEFQW